MLVRLRELSVLLLWWVSLGLADWLLRRHLISRLIQELVHSLPLQLHKPRVELVWVCQVDHKQQLVLDRRLINQVVQVDRHHVRNQVLTLQEDTKIKHEDSEASSPLLHEFREDFFDLHASKSIE